MRCSDRRHRVAVAIAAPVAAAVGRRRNHEQISLYIGRARYLRLRHGLSAYRFN